MSVCVLPTPLLYACLHFVTYLSLYVRTQVYSAKIGGWYEPHIHSVFQVTHCTLLYSTVMHCTALHCTTLHCTTPHCTVLYCAARSLLICCANFTISTSCTTSAFILLPSSFLCLSPAPLSHPRSLTLFPPSPLFYSCPPLSSLPLFLSFPFSPSPSPLSPSPTGLLMVDYTSAPGVLFPTKDCEEVLSAFHATRTRDRHQEDYHR